MYPAAPPPPPPPDAAAPPQPTVVATAVLTLAAATLGLLPWPRPGWAPSSTWLVTDVPGPLWALLLTTAAVCLATAVVLVRREAGLRLRDGVTWAWFGLVVAAAAALVWNALYAAALSNTVFGGIIPIFHWLFTSAPAVLAGWLFSRRGRPARVAAALGTGVVTLPLFALWPALLMPDGPIGGQLVRVLAGTALLGLAPLVAGVALAGAMDAGPAPTTS
ncbi:hypothetical protein ACI784_06845 [Geodermatophilus sp. SYSU D01186]